MTMALQEEGFRNFTEKDPRWKLVERIVAAPGFAKSPRLSSLLTYIVKQSLQGRDEELNEQCIGERVFGRSIGYDPRDDNIVRSHASRLRQRLEAYFRDEGGAEPLRIAIPRGSYVPQFERVETTLSGEPYAAAPTETAEEEPILPSTEKRPVFPPHPSHPTRGRHSKSSHPGSGAAGIDFDTAGAAPRSRSKGESRS